MGVKTMKSATALAAGVLAIVASLAFAAPAGATITKTHITTPAKSPTYLTYNGNHPNNFRVAGTTNSTSPSTDTVDILCFYGDDGQYETVASDVTLGSDGSFSVAAPVHNVYDSECNLAAVPSGDTTLEPVFTGPRIEVSERQSYPILGGPNDGKLYDYYIWGQQTALADDYDSISSCGLCDSYLLDSTGGLTSIVFYGNAWFNYGNENDTATNTRSDIQVDGRDAYMGYSANRVFGGSSQEPGFPTLTYHVSQNSSTGDVTITETDQIARCTGSPTYPPTSTTCPSFKPTGVEVKRKMVQNALGQMVWITDSFTSTDGHAHTLDLLYDNAQCLQNNSCTASKVGYRFPGQHAYAAHAPGNTVHAAKGIGSIYVKVLGAPDGDPYTGQAAITFGQAPTNALFVNPAFGVDSNFTMHYAGKVPARGSLTYRFVYSTAFTYAAVHRDALTAQRALKAGRVAAVPASAAPPRLPAGSADMPIGKSSSKHLHH